MHIIEIDNYLSKSDCEYLLDFAKNSTAWSDGGDSFWDNRIIHLASIPDNKVNDIYKKVLRDIQNIIIKEYRVNQIYPDTIQIVKWNMGDSQDPHSDSINIDGTEHVTPWRNFGSIIYLNDDYLGGETFYPNQNLEITPKSGKMVIHPADLIFIHGVKEIMRGERYTMPSFWTTDEKHKLGVLF